MITLAWPRPSSHDQHMCVSGSKSREFNYDAKYLGATMDAVHGDLNDAELRKDGYLTNHARVKLGCGIDVYNKGKALLKQWRHFQLRWAYVDQNTPIRVGEKLCVCNRELFLWFLNPLEILYVHDGNVTQNATLKVTKRKPDQLETFIPIPRGSHGRKLFSFVSGTLNGHLLAGEERFSVEWNQQDDSVWFEILSFSKPATLLSMATYPYVMFKQKLFARQSMDTMVKAIQQ